MLQSAVQGASVAEDMAVDCLALDSPEVLDCLLNPALRGGPGDVRADAGVVVVGRIVRAYVKAAASSVGFQVVVQLGAYTRLYHRIAGPGRDEGTLRQNAVAEIVSDCLIADVSPVTVHGEGGSYRVFRIDVVCQVQVAVQHVHVTFLL